MEVVAQLTVKAEEEGCKVRELKDKGEDISAVLASLKDTKQALSDAASALIPGLQERLDMCIESGNSSADDAIALEATLKDLRSKVIEDKKAKKKREQEEKKKAQQAPEKKEKSAPSKKELNKMQRKEGKSLGKEKDVVAAATVAVVAPVANNPAVSSVSDNFPLISLVVSTLSSLKLVKSQDATLAVDDVVLRGDATIAQFIARKSGSYYGQQDVDWMLSATQIDEWIDLCSGSTLSVETIDLHLSQRTFMVGSELSLADIAVWAMLLRGKHDHSACKNICRWYDVVSLPAFGMAKGMFEKRSSGTTAVKAKKKDMFTLAGLKDAIQGKVVTRFPPEPSGHLHIGHVKAIFLNKYYADRYGGTMLVRFDDTNPSKEKVEYEEGIIEDLKMLGINFGDKVSYTSDHFDMIIDFAIKLIKEGNAYMDDTPQAQMSEERRAGIEGSRRNESIELNLERYLLMLWTHEEALTKGKKLGVFKTEDSLPTGLISDDWCLRAKIDMSSKNKALCDPVIFRGNSEPHARTKNKYRAYPTYDLACPIVDSHEGVTHAMRDIQYRDRAPLYYWFFEKLGIRKVEIQDFSRLNFIYTLMSKRNLKWFVDEGRVPGWDDPRFPTVKGILRRGMQLDALYEFMVAQGSSKNVIDMEWDKFWAMNKKYIERTAPRFMGVAKDSCVEVHVKDANGTDFVEQVKTVPNHPKDPTGETFGTKSLFQGPVILMEEEDLIASNGLEQVAVGENILLAQWGVMKVTAVVEEAGKLTRVDVQFVPDGDVKSPKRKLHWVIKSPHCVDVTMHEFDYLISKPKLEDGEDFRNFINPVSSATTGLICEPGVRNLKQGDFCQLFRRGFYRVDRASSGKTPADLFTIPDGKTKSMSTLGSKLAHR